MPEIFDNKWYFKIELKDESVFEQINQELEIKIPEELIDYIKKYNAASPEKNCIMINGIERVLDYNLSFNETEEEAPTFAMAFEVIDEQNYIPFAYDPFGNYFCYALKEKKIAFYNHEASGQKLKLTELSLTDFLNNLY